MANAQRPDISGEPFGQQGHSKGEDQELAEEHAFTSIFLTAGPEAVSLIAAVDFAKRNTNKASSILLLASSH